MRDRWWVWLLALFAMLVLVKIVFRNRAAPPEIPEDPNELMPLLAEDGVTRARAEFGIVLDYSPGSVQLVEGLLESLHARRVAGEMNDNRLNREAMTWGAYIGEVIRRLKSGRWERGDDVGGPDSFPVLFNGNKAYPVGWCVRRILNGVEDNVWGKFRLLNRLDQLDGGENELAPVKP